MKQKLVFTLLLLLAIGGGVLLGQWIDLSRIWSHEDGFSSPLGRKKELPYLKYGIANLKTYPFQTSQIAVGQLIDDFPEYRSFQFSYQTLGKKMTGQLNIPKSAEQSKTEFPVIILLRGYVPPEIYQTGVGTKNAAAVFAKQGYITLAPDFFGYGESDPETTDSWESRFQKPVSVIELIRSIQAQPTLSWENEGEVFSTQMDSTRIGIWAHSNGGQIALAALEATGEKIPTTLWAPVTVPFPYSILFFTDENADEGKSSRRWIAQFEEDYDVFDFSLTQHLDKLQAPLQIHHGSADDAALQVWSAEFLDKIEQENERREATQSAVIDVEYFPYPGADHNMRPVWNTVIERDLSFFAKHLK